MLSPWLLTPPAASFGIGRLSRVAGMLFKWSGWHPEVSPAQEEEEEEEEEEGEEDGEEEPEELLCFFNSLLASCWILPRTQGSDPSTVEE